MNDVNSLSHTSWNCKYYIVFAPKYRRKVFYKEKRQEVGKILKMLCDWKKIKIIEAEVYPDHVHMLVEIPPKMAVSSFMGYLKGKSSLMIYEKFPDKVQIQKSGVLVQRILRKYGREKCKKDSGIHQAPTGRRPTGRTNDHGKHLKPVYG